MKLAEYQVAASRTSSLNDAFVTFEAGATPSIPVGSDVSKGAWRLANASLGLCSEASELIGVLLDHAKESSKDVTSLVIKELGDVCWYIAEVANTLGIVLDNPVLDEEQKMRVVLFLEISAGSGVVSDYLKKFLFHGKTLDLEFVKEHLSKLLTSAEALANKHETNLDHVLQVNVDKLKKRYVSGFSSEASELRLDLKVDN